MRIVQRLGPSSTRIRRSSMVRSHAASTFGSSGLAISAPRLQAYSDAGPLDRIVGQLDEPFCKACKASPSQLVRVRAKEWVVEDSKPRVVGVLVDECEDVVDLDGCPIALKLGE